LGLPVIDWHGSVRLNRVSVIPFSDSIVVICHLVHGLSFRRLMRLSSSITPPFLSGHNRQGPLVCTQCVSESCGFAVAFLVDHRVRSRSDVNFFCSKLIQRPNTAGQIGSAKTMYEPHSLDLSKIWFSPRGLGFRTVPDPSSRRPAATPHRRPTAVCECWLAERWLARVLRKRKGTIVSVPRFFFFKAL